MHQFNSDFYVTGATVIPVLYLALTLQGNSIRDLMTRWQSVNKEASWRFWPQIRAVSMAMFAIAGASLSTESPLSCTRSRRLLPRRLARIQGTTSGSAASF